MNSRTKNFNSPLNIYEVHLSSWKIKDNQYDFYNYNEIADMIILYVKEMGYTHIELLPITEHPFDGSWKYQVSGYFSATSRYGNPKDLMKFINKCHNSNFALQNRHPNVMLIAEDSSVFSKITAPVVYGGIGFDYKWNFGWMHDSLEYFQLTPYEKSSNRHKLTFSIKYFYNELYLLPVSHDEVSHFKNSVVSLMYGDYDEKFSNLKCFYLFMMTHPGKNSTLWEMKLDSLKRSIVIKK